MVSETPDVFYLNAPKMFGHHNMSATKSSKKSVWPWPPIYTEKSSHYNYNLPSSHSHRTSLGSSTAGSKSSNNNSKYKTNEMFHNAKNSIYNNKEINFNPFPFKCSDRDYDHYPPPQSSHNYSKKEKQYMRNGRTDTKYSEKSNGSSNQRSRFVVFSVGDNCLKTEFFIFGIDGYFCVLIFF